MFLHFQDGEAEAGYIGVATTVVGMVGSVIAGVVLDKTHKFKWVNHNNDEQNCE